MMNLLIPGPAFKTPKALEAIQRRNTYEDLDTTSEIGTERRILMREYTDEYTESTTQYSKHGFDEYDEYNHHANIVQKDTLGELHIFPMDVNTKAKPHLIPRLRLEPKTDTMWLATSSLFSTQEESEQTSEDNEEMLLISCEEYAGSKENITSSIF